MPNLLVDRPFSRDFPVTWEVAGDDQLFWQQDRLHFPDPITPLDFSLSAQVMDQIGFNRAAQRYGLPVALKDRHINGYLYIAMIPQAGEPAPHAEDILQAAMDQLGELWQTCWLPEVQSHLAYWETFDLQGATLPVLRQHLVETEQRLQRMWEIHFLLFLPMMLTISTFDERVHDLFPEAGPVEAYELLAGFDTHMLRSAQALWRLSQQASTQPTVHQVLLAYPPSAVLPQLASFTAGQQFLAELNMYLAQFGKRADSLNLDRPSWIEDPIPVIQTLQNYLAQPERNLIAEQNQLVAKRQQRVAQARAHLYGYPQPLVDEFEHLLQQAQVAYLLREDHTYWIDFQACYHARQVALALGRCLASAGVISQRDDVFFLTLVELKETLANLALDRRALVAQRQAQARQFQRCTPPPALGVLPAEPPPDSPFTRMLLKMEGASPPLAKLPDELQGHAGAPGVARGVAKVIRHAVEVEKLVPGDILVTRTLAPAWTQLFTKAVGIVTETGGALSHAAIVAREYGIPAVVGLGLATSLIQDGQTLEIDGNTGLVRIILPSRRYI